jgi:hypothetical protein
MCGQHPVHVAHVVHNPRQESNQNIQQQILENSEDESREEVEGDNLVAAGPPLD